MIPPPATPEEERGDRLLLAHTISQGDDTDVSEWDDCLLMADRILAAGWVRRAPDTTIIAVLEEVVGMLRERRTLSAKATIKRVIKELSK